jgi:hypothetical protein
MRRFSVKGFDQPLMWAMHGLLADDGLGDGVFGVDCHADDNAASQAAYCAQPIS